jgi:hypothetical protein
MMGQPDARYMQLLGDGGVPSALLVAYGKKCTTHILERWRSRPQEAPKGRVNPELVDLVSRAVPAVAESLSKGNLFQIVGTPELLRGIDAGTHALMQTSTGTLGTVVNTSSGQIAGQLRFAPSTTLAPVVGPTMAWTLLNAVAGTLQLQRIDSKLGVLVRQIERLSFRNEAEVMGRIAMSLQILDELLDEYRHHGSLNAMAIGRLVAAEQEVGAIYERNRILVDDFAARTGVVLGVGGKGGAEQATRLVEEDGQAFLHDTHVLSALMIARNRVTQLQIYHDLAEQPSYVDHRLARAASRIEAHKEILDQCTAVDALRVHAGQCAREMSWFQRNVFSRSTARKAKEISTSGLIADLSAPTIDVTPGLCFWQESGGAVQARLVSQ